MVTLVLVNPCLGSTITFTDDFTALDPLVWEPTEWPVGPAPYIHFEQPNPGIPVVIEGRSAVELSLTTTDHGIAGYQTIDRFTASEIRLEVVFRPLGAPYSSIDGIFYIRLLDDTVGRFFDMGFFFGGYGGDRGVSTCPWHIVGAQCIWWARPGGIDYQRWYRMVIEADCATTVMTLWTDDDPANPQMIWQAVHDAGLAQFGPDGFRIAFTQSMGTPGQGRAWTARAALDRIEAVMEPPVTMPPVQFADNGHYYQYIPGTLTWQAAQADAASRTFNGLQGHLATITSAAENDFIFDFDPCAVGWAWIGGSDEAVEGEWRWVDGPESGIQFSQDATPTPPFNFANWYPGYPDGGVDEYHAVVYLGPTLHTPLGPWGDIPYNHPGIWGYVAEFSEPANEPPTAICQSVTVSAGTDCEADASIDGGSYDPDGDPITLVQEPPGPYPLGDTEVTLTVADGSASAQCTATVTVTGGAGSVAGTVLADGGGLANVIVDLVAADGSVHFATTHTDGAYSFADVPVGTAEVSITVPLGYTGNDMTQAQVSCGAEALADFTLASIPTVDHARSKGYWKHQANSCLTGRGNPHEDCNDMNVTYPGTLFNNFHQNALAGIHVDGVTHVGGEQPSLENIGTTLSGRGSHLDRAKAEYLTFLLNIASNRLRTNDVVSADGATVSQAVQHVAALIDGGASEQELAKDICEAINSGQLVEAGVIGLDLPQIPFSPRPAQALEMRTFPNPLRQSTTVSYVVSEAGPVEIVVYDVSGRRVRELLGQHVEAGLHRATWDGRDDAGRPVGNGEYFVRVRTLASERSHKVLVTR